jgi:hypothetical protein
MSSLSTGEVIVGAFRPSTGLAFVFSSVVSGFSRTVTVRLKADTPYVF